MKAKLFLSALLSFAFCLLSSQVPQGFNYQAIARDGSGNPVTSTLQVKIGFQSDTLSSAYIWEELHSNVKPNSSGLFSVVIGTGSRVSGDVLAFSDIDWTKTPVYFKVSINSGSGWKYMWANQLWSVPYSLVAGNLGGAVKKLEVMGEDISSDEALFEVKRKDGETMFAVYNHGVRVFMPLDTLSKARKGGFAIGGFSKTKGTVQDYFVVNPDSIRAYIDTNPEKARKGGFAIGGFNKTKANEEYLRVTRDSTRIYINDLSTKARKGGFAIGGFDRSKAGNVNFLNIETDTSGIINPPQNRILWYPVKNAFLTGKVFIENPDSVGVNSFASGYKSKAIGDFSQALGVNAIARGIESTAIGNNVIASGMTSFALGHNSIAKGSTSRAMGSGALASGSQSTSIGYATTASGDVSTAIGTYTTASGDGAMALGSMTKASGNLSTAMGRETKATAIYATAMGYSTTSQGRGSLSAGYSTIASGYYSSVFGYNAKARPFCTFVIGQYNDSAALSLTSWNDADPLFIAGNGTSDINRKNAFTVYKNGNAYIQGSLAIGTTASVTGLDIRKDTRIGNGLFLTDGIEMSNFSTGNRYTYIDFHGDDTYNDFGLRLARDPGLNSNSGLYHRGTGSLVLHTFEAAPITFNTSGAQRMTITAGGNVGIGSANPAAKLEVSLVNPSAWSGNLKALRIYAPDMSYYLDLNTLIIAAGNTGYNFSPNGNTGLVISTPGYSGIGRSPVTNRLEVEGNASKTTAGSWLANSDIRIKTKVQDIENAQEILMKLHPVKFMYSDEWMKRNPSIQDRFYYNFIAQEFYEVFPESVQGSGEYLEGQQNEILQLDSYNAQIVAVKALQEVIEENHRLKSELQSLKERMCQIEGLLAKTGMW